MSYSILNYIIHQFTIAIELIKVLSDDYKVYLNVALQGKKGPSAKDLRLMAFRKNLYGE